MNEPYEKPAWKLQAPKDGEIKKKDVEGKTYHWCTGHKEWTIHTSASCRLNSAEKEEKKQEKQANISNFGDKKAVPFGSKDKDNEKKEDKKDDKGYKSEEKEEKKEAATTRKFVRVANLDPKSPSCKIFSCLDLK